MKTRRATIGMVFLCVAGIVLFSSLLAGKQQRGMPGMHGMSHDQRSDMVTIHSLFADHNKIERKVTKLANGVETTTESDDAEVAARIIEHAYAMKERLERNAPICMWDPLFAELFANASKIRMDIVKTPRGVTVRESSDDPRVVKLIQAHADVVSRFVEKGMTAMHERHDVP